MEENTITWKIVNSLWVLVSFIFLLNGIGIIYAGKKANNSTWFKIGLIFEAIPVLLFLLAVVDPNSPYGITLTSIYLLTWVLSIIYSFFILPKFLDSIKFNKNVNNIQNNQYNPQNMQYQYNQQSNNSNNSTTHQFNQNPMEDYDYQQPSTDTSENSYNTTENAPTVNNESNPKFDLIDINYVPEDIIKQIPGLNNKQSEKIIAIRNNGDYIESFDDLKVKLDLTDNQINELKKYIKITPVSSRRLDL